MKCLHLFDGIGIVAAAFLLFVLSCTGCDAGSPELVCKTGTVAIDGYDPVAYFRAGKAVRGDGAIRFSWHGADWHFSSRENMNLFAASPEKYAPQYGGFCAWALSEARQARTDPEVWKIVNGKLYLNCSRSAMGKWERDIPGNIKKADANWKKRTG